MTEVSDTWSRGLRVVLVGHNLQAKCAVGNAVTNQKKGFKQFQCRTNFLVKRIVGNRAAPTVEGKELLVTVTPNLNTPAWHHTADGIIRRYNDVVFVYVKAPGKVRVNDTESIQAIKRKYRKDVLVVTYCELYVSQNEDVSGIVLNSNYNSRDGSIFANALLFEIGTTFFRGSKNIEFKGPQQVGARKVSQSVSQKKPEPHSERSTAETDFQILQSVAVPSERKNTNEYPLKPKLEEEDVLLFSKTLKCGRAKSNLVRVNFIGNQSAGKTTLVKRLQDMDVQCPDKAQKPTEALEINQIWSRCIEIDGQKHWETDEVGYTNDLNEQRMAQAMKNVLQAESNKHDKDFSKTIVEVSEMDDYMFGSSVEEEYIFTDTKQTFYEANIKENTRKDYLKRVIRKKDFSQGERMYVSYWDFAGQSTYYSTHQMFMSPSAVYVLVVDLSLDLKRKVQDSLNFRTGVVRECTVEESLIFWISSIKAFATDGKGGSAPILIVGTHIDMLKEETKLRDIDIDNLIDEKFSKIREVLKMSEAECIAIDNVNQDFDQIDALRNRILEAGLGVIDEDIPAQWIDLERHINLKKLEGKVFMTFPELEELDKELDFPIKDQSRLEAFLSHQHKRGYLIYFMEDNLKSIIILDPSVLARFLNVLMRSSDDRVLNKPKGADRLEKAYNNNGIINRDYITKSAELIPEIAENNQTVTILLHMLLHLSIIRPYQHEGTDMRYLLPCLLPQRPELFECKGKVFVITFTDNHFPPQLFHILLAGLLNEWKPIEKSLGKPEIYNLYASFRIESETKMAEIYWEHSCIYIKIIDFSQKRPLTVNDILNVLKTVKKNVNKIFQVYRHNFSQFEVRCQCPTHADKFVSLKELQQFGESMCFQGHCIIYRDIFGSDDREEKEQFLNEKPSDLHLGRLARQLKRETGVCLAARLRLDNGVLVDTVSEKILDKSMRRLMILYEWKTKFGAMTLGDLIELLTETLDFAEEDLIQCLKKKGGKHKYALGNYKLDVIPIGDIDIQVVCNNTGECFPFLALELGLQMSDILKARENHRNSVRDANIHVLRQWRSENPKTSTSRALLDAATDAGFDTTDIQTQLMKAY